MEVSAVANGEITPGEAGELAKVVDAYTRTLEMVDFEARLRGLEGGNNRATETRLARLERARSPFSHVHKIATCLPN